MSLTNQSSLEFVSAQQKSNIDSMVKDLKRLGRTCRSTLRDAKILQQHVGNLLMAQDRLIEVRKNNGNAIDIASNRLKK